MNKIKIAVLTLCLIVTSAFGATNVTTSEATSKGILGLFSNREASLQVGFGYQDIKASKFAPSFGVEIFPTKYLGFRGTTSVAMENATAFNNGDFVALLRLPIWVIQPYAGGGARVSTARMDEWSPILVGGVSAKINKGWSVFTEINYDLADKTTTFSDYQVRAGVNLRFW